MAQSSRFVLLVPPMQDGLVTTYRDDGSLLAEITYESGRRHGPYRDYWSNGRLACEGQYLNEIQEGEWRFYREDGNPLQVVQFKGGKEVVDWDHFFQAAN